MSHFFLFFGGGVSNKRCVNLIANTFLSLIRQKGKCQNGGNSKTKHAKFSEKQIFLTPKSKNKKFSFATLFLTNFTRNIYQ